MIDLNTGNPEGLDAASNTRLVLPFGYRARRRAAVPADRTWHYRADVRVPSSREERYFTPETCAVLFRRAKWLVLEDVADSPRWPEWGRVRLDCRSHQEPGRISELIVRFERPRLILFEWEEARERSHDGTAGYDGECDPLAVGFLSLDFWFENAGGGPVQLDELLGLNDLLRYWRRPYEGHESGALAKHVLPRMPLNWADPTAGLVGDRVDEDSLYTRRWLGLLGLPIKDDDGAWILEPTMNAHPDDRAFVWTTAVLAFGAVDVARPLATSGLPSSALSPWIRLLNVDRPGAEASEFETAWAKDHTYGRWAHLGTLYGFVQHAGAMLCGPHHARATPGAEPPNAYWQHFRTLYFQQVLLFLYLRTASFAFSRALTDVTIRLRSGKELPECQEFSRLRWGFVRLTNLYRYPLISNQQQGVEMYEQACEHLDVDTLFDEVHQQIAAAHEFQQAAVGRDQNQAMTLLTVVGFAALLLETLGKPEGQGLGVLVFALAVVFSRYGAAGLNWLANLPGPVARVTGLVRRAWREMFR